MTKLAAERRQHGILSTIAGIARAALALLLAASLVIGAVLWQREAVIMRWPAAAGVLAHACASVGCSTAPPRAIDALSLNATTLRALKPGHFTLSFSLENHSVVPLAWPALEIMLSDKTEHIVVRKVLLPTDYLADGWRAASGIPALTQLRIRLALDGPSTALGSYRVLIFYP
ncbi:MAG: DUF3426 domain-containing protein [Janthinobacterium lividum]